MQVSLTEHHAIMMCMPATWEAHHFHHAIDTLNFSLINQRHASHIDPTGTHSYHIQRTRLLDKLPLRQKSSY